MRLYFLFLIVLLQITHNLDAQSVKELIGTADQLYGKKNYSAALITYLKAYEVNPDDASLNFKIGLTYLYSDTKSKAALYIDKAYRLNPGVHQDIDYHLGVAFRNTNEFKKAIRHFDDFKRKNKKLASIADEKIAECMMADSLAQNELNVVIENVGDIINTKFSEYSPIVSADGNTMIFTSNRSDNEARVRAGMNFEDIYITTRSGNSWSTPKKISENINTDKYNEAAASLSPDGKTLFLYSEEGAGDIHVSKLVGDTWSKPVPLNRNINTGMFWETSATLSHDGQKLYFTSNRDGGYGELDIYVSLLDGKGEWGKAVNVGPTINTSEDEDSPFIHTDGVTLYFSSNGHRKLGNSDIFFSELRGNKWTKPENIGYPINSWEYDGFFSISTDKKKAYYSTVREGGKGETDIYSITFLEPKYKPKPTPVVVVAAPPVRKNDDFVAAFIQEQKNKKVVTILKGKVIDELTADPLSATISLVDNQTNTVVAKISTEEGSGDFELIIPHGGNYGVTTEKAGYLFNSINFSLPAFAEYQEIDTHIIMVKAEIGSKVVLKNIFFDPRKTELKTESVAEVEKIKELLMGNPVLRVQINGHTDNSELSTSGNASSYKELSLKRASAVITYLTSQGVEHSRLSAKGFGLERPIVSNDDEESGREINRRTEIEIIQ
ncbi:tetratricopeptide repeat protein [Chryseotalea sanaruensis]|uniref:Tetratricopeptide repeat protein n=1 Tax=Chryseotalea sanaruensis TaxID=2482724 RepID=A0A401U648_9BACT|nr:OmpA family protein [Chryseotalea sanaruensis]GCC50276.1 tetratricopeptide repeat protein [Chryseotalea sanaruensis]